jgi:Ca2+/Na+ antiporter
MSEVTSMGNAEEKGSSSVNGKALIFAGIAVIIILLIVVIVLLFTGRNGKKEETKEETKRAVVLNEENAEEVAEDFFSEEYTPPGYFTATMNNEWDFATGDAVSENAYVANDSSNTNDIYFDVFIDGDEENSIYQSPVIPLGGELREIKLSKKLSAGSYKCIMIYHLVDEEQNTISTVRVGITINVNS